jgi:hypothetical protein
MTPIVATAKEKSIPLVLSQEGVYNHTRFLIKQKSIRRSNMKKVILVFGVLLFAGCQDAVDKKAFNIQDLRLGMQRFEVEGLANTRLELVSTELISGAVGYTEDVYRLQNCKKSSPFQKALRNTAIANYPDIVKPEPDCDKPYLLTFLTCPALTRQNCLDLIAKNNVTDFNDINQIMELEGYRPNLLCKVTQDDAEIRLQAQIQQAASETRFRNSLLGGINNIGQELEMMRHQQFIQHTQDEFWRMQQK